ncbi:MAG: CheR family methyltransferase [Bacteroidales bacterium]
MKKNVLKSEDESLSTPKFVKKVSIDFPVVGIGASAGGLEALQEFFQSLPSLPGAAFVLVQHLSPDYRSLMDELLARYTSMMIHRVEDGMQVQENHIYLIPPRMNMTIFQGKLFLTEHSITRTLNLPIDIFLRSLAKDQEKNAIAIILSGTGSDGTLGIRAIKESGGMIMVQDDRSAKFDGMPRSSISTGVVDYILPPAKLANELVSYIKHPFIKKKENIESQLNNNENQLAKVIAILREAKNVDFSCYKENTIIRRLEKRISINRFENIDDYVKFLATNTREVTVLFNELLIGVTRFFRDEEAFKKITTEVLSSLMKQGMPRKEIRVWVAACSTGEEAYSLAILFKEYMAENNMSHDIKIFATDLDTASLEFAGVGLYPDSIPSDVSSERLSKYFTKRDNGYQVNESIRSMIIFAKHNILQDPPFSKIDLISCRNMLIYLDNEAQQKVLSTFYFALNDNAFLFLGSSESLGNVAEGFLVLDSKAKIYRQQKGFRPPQTQNFTISSVHRSRTELKNISSYIKNIHPKTPSLDGIFDEILGDFVPPSVIIDENYQVIHSIHQVSKYVSLPIGMVSLNLLKMLPKEMSIHVNSLIRRAEKKRNELVIENVPSADSEIKLSISCRKIVDRKTNEIYYLISFIENERKERTSEVSRIESVDINVQYLERIDELEREIQFKSESLQATVEELETSNEELQSSNEELIAANEELQSTNEELQSVNEELYTVNSEHIKKIEELTELYADMDNLLRNTDIGSLFLDSDLTIRKINDVASRLTNVLSSDIGRPIHHLSVNAVHPDFLNDIYAVSQKLTIIERELFQSNGECFLMRVFPYRTAENAVEGTMVTFINVSLLKESQKSLAILSNRLDVALHMGDMSWWEWDYTTNTVRTGEGKARMLGYEPGEIAEGYEGWTALVHPDDYKGTMQAMMDLLQNKAPYYETEYRIKHKNGTYLWYRDKGGIVTRQPDGKPHMIMGMVVNITNEKCNIESKIGMCQKAVNQLDVERNRADVLFHNSPIAILEFKDGNLLNINQKASVLFGFDANKPISLTSNQLLGMCTDVDGNSLNIENSIEGKVINIHGVNSSTESCLLTIILQQGTKGNTFFMFDKLA